MIHVTLNLFKSDSEYTFKCSPDSVLEYDCHITHHTRVLLHKERSETFVHVGHFRV